MKNSFLLKEAKNITKQKKRTKNARSAHTGQDHFKLLFSHHFISLSTFFSYDLDIDFESPREIRRFLAYYERKRLERCKYPELYEQGVRFIALQVANEEVLSYENSPLDRAHQENALRQDLAIDLACIGEKMLSPVPADAHQTREEYRRLCDELSAVLAAKKSDKAPTAAAFQATQQAWEAYCRLFEDVIPDNDLMPEDDWRVWLLEKRILQLRRLKYRMLGRL